MHKLNAGASHSTSTGQEALKNPKVKSSASW